mmetsp:Transcript_22171/g.66564  ORF Transcript_22171/g.66564 Transcript_22171/m.66564 type:complete len:256 (-) Transcript_22171:699-1466(-)
MVKLRIWGSRVRAAGKRQSSTWWMRSATASSTHTHHGSGPSPCRRGSRSYVGVSVSATLSTVRVTGRTSASSLRPGRARQARTRDAPARPFRTSAPTSRASPPRSPSTRSTVSRLASSCRRASSGKRWCRWDCVGSRSAIWRTGCWNHQSRRSTALANCKRRSASEGQCARSAISKSARHTRAAFLATYAASDESVKAWIGAREMCACSNVAALPAGSSAKAASISDRTGQQASDARNLSNSANSSARGLSCSNS